ncbi:MAG: hypothetical protein HYT37_03180 [Candidatus Sungbacteria bacterium]|nr:hypothetical protein [Candidatus Sungbacteria bacterium]
MLLKSFEGNLEAVREMAKHQMGTINPSELGRSMTQSFIVEFRAALHGQPIHRGVFPESKEVELVHVGKLLRNKNVLTFVPYDELRKDAAERICKLGTFLRKWLKSEHSNFLGAFTWGTVFYKSRLHFGPAFLPCYDMLVHLGIDILGRLMKKDKMLKRISLEKCEEAFCLYIHDAIASGCGIEIEWLGVIKPDFSLEIDARFEEELKILHNPPPVAKDPDFFFSDLKTGSLPRFSHGGLVTKKH